MNIEPYRALAARGSSKTGPDPEVCFVESEFAVARLLASDLEVLDILATPAVAERLEPLAKGVPIAVRETAEIKAIVGFAFHRGCIARARRPPHAVPPAVIGGSSLVLDRITDPVNVGAILRTARAFGIDHVLTTEGCGDAYERRAVRASMGHVFALALYDRLSLDELTAWLGEQRDQGVAVIGTDLSGQPLTSSLGGRKVCVVLGNEGHGLSPGLRTACDETVTIAMEPAVDSLNVGAAAAIVLHWLTHGPSRPLADPPPHS